MELWAGSTLTRCSNNGNKAPKQTLVNTIKLNDVVIAMVSCMGVKNIIARIKPAIDNNMDNKKAIANSRSRYDGIVLECNVPNAKDRITI